jgi:hypothetical protein
VVEQLRDRADTDDGGGPDRLDRLDERTDRRVRLREGFLEIGEVGWLDAGMIVTFRGSGAVRPGYAPVAT